ncbi:PD-(D/E)XK nuclease family protein [Desulfovibrio litoralis]|uniref:PD-(D/E)XK nuclease superfamily protein n=1 Tax=Desulfovibrio litoralis DSM 11393 TaxID=1121455 RepID=A0A1M7T7J8_9BACT|nr:PD-(D/E)XK nuclease family protein [Desulfovibrio litoralis]SHN66688.1 PD-(D/E)XK nuclease superfamily protein [Desulfovibrio litoralis DSM 11393]
MLLDTERQVITESPNAIRLRASSLPDLLDCPRRWESKNIYKKYLPKTEIALLGTAIHKGTAAFDLGVLNLQEISVDDAVGVAVEEIWQPKDEIKFEELTQADLEKITKPLVTKYCNEYARTLKYLAVELTCPDLLISDLGIILTGTTDRVYQDEFENIGIIDVKTGKTAVSADGTVKTSGHKTQLAVYELLTAHALGCDLTAPALIIGMQTGATAKAQRIGIGTVKNAKDVLIGNSLEKGVLTHASNVLHSGIFYGNPKSMMCHVKYCPNFLTCTSK